ncbi:MAG: peroxiredoxin [Candidatus Marsarchaeota archaeon]|nr:peroxiredoxin [Candidatus Marsarchaeota archaeon]
MLSEGDMAPGFKLPGSDGKEHSLSELSGKYVILYFYPKDNTPGCTIEANNFNKRLDEIRGLNAEVIGVSKDDYKSHEKFINKYGLKFLLLSDTESKTIKDYGAYGDRGIFGVGTLRNTYLIGKGGKIIKIFEKVNPKGHADEIISAIKEAEA